MSNQQTLDSKFIKGTIRIRCKICGEEFEQITNTHLKTHGTTMSEYREQFPDALLVSDSYKQKLRDNHWDNSGKNHPNYGKTGKDNPRFGKYPTGKDHPMFGVHRYGKDHPMFGKHQTEEAKQKQSKAQLGENNHMHGKTKETDEGIRKAAEKSSKTKKEFYATEEGQQWLDENNRGKNHSSWKGGISFEPYCIKFDDDLRERVRNFFDRCCYICGKNETENRRHLSVYHVSYDKMVCCNDVKPLFVPLCISCHAKTQKDRKYWEEFFTVSLNYLTDGKCFIPKEVNKN